jgi:hypothetical protein
VLKKKKRKTEDRTGPVWGLAPLGRGGYRTGCRRVNVVEYYALMNENRKVRPAETVPGIRGDKGE